MAGAPCTLYLNRARSDILRCACAAQQRSEWSSPPGGALAASQCCSPGIAYAPHPIVAPALQNAALLAVPVAVSAAGMRAACSCTPSATTGSWRCPRAPGATGSTWGTRAASPALRVSVRPSASASAPASAPAAHVGCAGAGGHLPPASCRCRPPRRRCLLLMAPDVCVDPLPCNQPACLLCPPISPVPRRRGCVPRHAGRARGRVRAQLCVQQRRGRV